MIPSGEVILGIDLGTTFSLVAYCDERGPHIIRDESGDGRLPSVIGLLAPVKETDGESSSTELLIGWAARKQAIENPLGTIYSIKRLIGKGATDLQRELPYLAYHVRPAVRDTLEIEVAGRRYTPQQISALILRELRERAERHLGRTIRKAAITVPAYFDDAQRQATRDAGEAAGLEVVRIINEPTAAALAYGIGLEDNDDKENTNTTGEKKGTEKTRRQAQRGAAQTVAIYDFGGGTFDVSILRIEDGVFQVLATFGDTHLGGDDLDRVLIELVTREVKERFGVAIDAPAIKQALRGLAEALKMQLSDRETARLELDLGKAGVFQREISRAEFEALVGGLVERTLALFDQALRDAKLEKSSLDHFILVGGSTRVPLVRRRVAEHFGRPPYSALNPDEVVALGAAIQGSILAGARPDLLLLDVTPLSLGIETMGGAMGKLILRNTTIPCRATENFTTFVDGQTAIKINVLQGERELAEHCRSLGEFELRGLPPMPAGIPKVEVEFLIDANGILNVAARELRSGKAASIQIVPNYGLTRAEIEQMTRAGIEHGRADVDAHRRIDLMNQVAFDTAKTEDMLRKFGHRLGAAERERLVDQIARLRALAQTEANLDRLHGALDAFGKSTIGLAELGIREALVQVDAGRTGC